MNEVSLEVAWTSIVNVYFNAELFICIDELHACASYVVLLNQEGSYLNVQSYCTQKKVVLPGVKPGQLP